MRRPKLLRRQGRVPEEMRRQVSEPAPSPAPPLPPPPLIKHQSYPQYSKDFERQGRRPKQEREVGSLLIRAVPAPERPSCSSGRGGRSPARASHTPAVRAGPPLSCNYCWNTVDDCGRILRRKTQYHCPECRTNLCIVPCFHEYHDPPAGPRAPETITCKPAILDH